MNRIVGVVEKKTPPNKTRKEGRGAGGKQAGVGGTSCATTAMLATGSDPVRVAPLQRFVAATVKDGAMGYRDPTPWLTGLTETGYYVTTLSSIL